MSVYLKCSKLWETERGRGPGKPYMTFKLRDPSFYGIQRAHVYRSGAHWNWVYWDIAGHDHRPPGTLGFATPERAALHLVRHLVRAFTLMVDRTEKLLRDSE